MNILFLATNYPYPPDTGHNLRTFNILKSLTQEHKVFFIGFTKRIDRVNAADPIHQLCTHVQVFTAPDDASQLRKFFSLFANLFSPYPYIAGKYFINDATEKIRDIIGEHHIDLVHFDLLHLSRYVQTVGSLPKVLTEHNVESERFYRLSKNSQNPFIKLFMRLQYKKLYKFEKNSCALFDVCITVSEKDLRTLQRMSSSTRFIVIPNGVDTAYFSPGRELVKSNSVVWTGGMGDVYNREAIEFFCRDIFSLIHEKIPDLFLNVVGSNPPSSLLRLAKRYSGVNILGYVDDIRPIVRSSAVFVAPMISGGGTKLKVLNAMSMGKAVITTSIGAEGIAAKHNEEIIVQDDPKLFSKAIIDLLADPDRSRRLGIRARKLIMEKYDWNKIGRVQNKLYRELSA